jgi:hypothetical protein
MPWPEGREALPHLRIRRVIVLGDLQQFAIPNDKEPAEQRPMPLLNLCDGALDLLGLAYVPRAHVQIDRADVQINNEPHPAAVSLLTFLSDRFLKCASDAVGSINPILDSIISQRGCVALIFVGHLSAFSQRDRYLNVLDFLAEPHIAVRLIFTRTGQANAIDGLVANEFGQRKRIT